jgi:signal transduction histidine kinase/ligand-binding sensor domain-containing protein
MVRASGLSLSKGLRKCESLGMSLRYRAFFTVAVIALATWCAAQPLETVDRVFRNWTTRDGLPQNRVRAITGTRDGFVWLGTDDGAVRFDGASFKTTGLREGLLAPIVLALHESADGSLWIGTMGGGLSVRRNGRIEQTYTTADGLPSNWVSGISADASDRVIAWTRNGPARFENGGFQAIKETPETPLPPESIHRDTDGVRWGLRKGQALCRWENDQWRLDPRGPKRANSLTADPHGQLWACGDGQLWNRDGRQWHSYPLPEIFGGGDNSLAIAADGTVWIVFRQSGICGFRNGGFIVPKRTPEPVRDLAESITATADGQIWITSANGLFRMAPQRMQVVEINNPETRRTANILGGLIENAPEEFIVATQGSGYFRLKNGVAERISNDPNLNAGVTANVTLKSRNGSIWLGGGTALYQMNPDLSISRRLLAGENVWALHEGQDGELWVGSAWGKLFRIKGEEIEQVDFGGAREPVKAIVQAPDGVLWVGTRGNGLFRRKGGQWRRFGRESGLGSEVIRTLYLDPVGRLWVGTDGGGLAIYQDERFVGATTREGLPSDTVSQILLDDDGRLWVGTHQGLAVLDKEDLARFEQGSPGDLHPLVINQSDGLPTDEFTIVPPIRTHDGSIAFATISGFVRLMPGDFQQDTVRPPVFLESIASNGTLLDATTEQISLPAGTERLEFKFSGLFFADPERLQFRNRLIGIEPDWAYVGNLRTAEYRNLGPGSYQFEVEASNGNGLWSPQPASVKVVIAPYFWQTLWFQILMGLLAIGGVGMLVRQRERRRARMKIEDLKRRRAVDAERERIARDLHDDVGASLTQIALQSQLAARNLTQQPERASSYLKEIFKTARQMTRSLDEIVWAVNPGNDVLDNFVSFLASFVQDFTDGAGLRSRFDLPDTVPPLAIPSAVRHHLYLAAKETLHNVVKHAGATEVNMRVTLEDGSCAIVLSDNGSGREATSDDTGADGLINLKTRLEQLSGTCTRHSRPGVGTSIEMRFPLG